MDYASLKVTDLKKLLKDRNLPLSGTKAELIERLQRSAQSVSVSSATTETSPAQDDSIRVASTETTASVAGRPSESHPTAPVVRSSTVQQVANPVTETSIPASESQNVVSSTAETRADASDVSAPETVAATATAGTSITDEDVIKELEKRIARAKKYGLDATAQEQEVARIRKFGVSTSKLGGLNRMDSALGIHKSTTKTGTRTVSNAPNTKTNDTDRNSGNNRRNQPGQTYSSSSTGSASTKASKPLTPEEAEKLKKRLERFGDKN